MPEEKKGFFNIVWDVLQPLVLYYLLHYAAFCILTFLFQTSLDLFGKAYADLVTAHAETATGVLSGISMLLAACPMIPMLRKELIAPKNRIGISEMVFSAILAITASLGLNVLLSITGLTEASGTFRDVSRQQFGVAFGIGVILYGVVSPLAEEIVFRGLVYNRMRKYFPIRLAIVLSGLFFGVYHGNLIQGIYGSLMGILMAYLYEETGRFFVPALFHGLANIAVYFIAFIPGVHEVLFRTEICVVLLTISILCLICLGKKFHLKKGIQ
ncbi:MAG: lysostaphin resistance A-like protein [Lachnospiraceae bacterium]